MAGKQRAHLAVLCCATLPKDDPDTSCADLVRLGAHRLHLSDARSELAIAPPAETRRGRGAARVAAQLASIAEFGAAASVQRFSLVFGARLVLGEFVAGGVGGCLNGGGSLREIFQRWSS